MEAAVVSSVLRMLAPKIFSFLEEKHKLRKGLERDIQYIRDELGMIAAAIEDRDRLTPGDGTDKAEKGWIELVRDLAYSIEDCMDRFLHRVSLEPGASSLFSPKIHRLKTTSTRTKFAAEIQKLRKVSEDLSKLREKYTGCGQSSTSSGASACTSASGTPTPEADDLVGMDVPLDELLELMREDEGQPKQLKVISVVGFGGLGKTVLARQVYNSVTVREQYEPRIWVRASEKGAGDVLKEILHEVQAGMQVHDNNCDVLSECLQSKRFLIVIDDMRTEYWNTIKNAFPKNVPVSSRVIVTTAIQSIANACSADNGHVYVMRALDKEHSKKLFFKEASLLDNDEPAAEQVVDKCDGLPLALITTAQLLQSKGQLTPKGCADLCRYMGERVEKEETLARVKHVLLQNYTSLPGPVLKACLLYLGIFPSGRPVRRKCLIRRWLAEGFVAADHRRNASVVAVDNFRELMNRSIIQPIDMSNNTEAKTCQTHGMMLEFILQKSMCENFITLLYDQAHLPDKVRRLSLHHNGAARVRRKTGIDLSRVRSLTVFGKADQHVLKFNEYELLRVLDLEECENLNYEHVKNICNLLLLRYLSLGGDITMLPKDISKLKFLETLDVRRAKKKIVATPIEVIKLPCLVHLLGMFRLPDVGQKEMSKLQTFLSENSNLETLAGFVADQSPEFPQLMSHMNSLTKVKVWCDRKLTGDIADNFKSSIQEFIQRGTNVNDARSLSLSFKGCPQDFQDFHLEQESYYLSSLKLQGELRSLPPFVTKLGGVTELCLSSPGQLSGDILANLRSVPALLYLKLIATQLGGIVLEQGELRSLRRLCIVVQSMTSLENREGALLQLESLCLLCEHLNGLCGITIERFGRLKEVALDDCVSDDTKKVWEEAAKKHPKRPRVSLVKTKEVAQKRMASSEGEKKMITPKSLDGEEFEVEAVAMESQTIRHVIEDNCADNGIPILNVNSKILSNVNSNKHVLAVAAAKLSNDKNDNAATTNASASGGEDLKNWDADFVKVDQDTLFDPIRFAGITSVEGAEEPVDGVDCGNAVGAKSAMVAAYLKDCNLNEDNAVDFFSIPQHKLQRTCKHNDIPANTTNVAMVEALAALEEVQGIEEVIDKEVSKVASPVDKIFSLPGATGSDSQTTSRTRMQGDKDFND